MAKTSVTFRLDSELATRLKDAAEKSGGKLTQVQIVEAALADKFAIKDSGRLLAKVNESQQTALTLVKEQSSALAEFQQKVSTGINAYSKRLHDDVSRLEQTTTQELRSATASVRTVEHQVADMIGTLRQIEDSVQRHAQARLEAWQYVTIGVMMGFSLLGVASVVWWVLRWSGRI
jgi:predicted transcriptional regulator